jgi:hypothetical protein
MIWLLLNIAVTLLNLWLIAVRVRHLIKGQAKFRFRRSNTTQAREGRASNQPASLGTTHNSEEGAA